MFPSYEESFGMVFLECTACGCPTIGANSGGPKEFAKPEQGVLVEEEPEWRSEEGMKLKCPEPRSRVRYVPEALEVVEEAEDGTFSENIGMFAAGEDGMNRSELLAFRREISRKAQLDESLLTPSHSSASHQPRPARLLDILPFAPWCGKCMPQAPDGQLPLKPDELVLGQASDIQALTENINEEPRCCF
eukprot:g2821.t1